MLHIAIDNSHSFVCQPGTNKAAKNNRRGNESDLYVCECEKIFGMNNRVNPFEEKNLCLLLLMVVTQWYLLLETLEIWSFFDSFLS